MHVHPHLIQHTDEVFGLSWLRESAQRRQRLLLSTNGKLVVRGVNANASLYKIVSDYQYYVIKNVSIN